MPSAIYNALENKVNQKTALPIPKTPITTPGYMSSPIKPLIKPTGIQSYSDYGKYGANKTASPSGRSDLQGASYYENLAKSSNPSEKQAGETWLAKQTTPGLGNIGNTQGGTSTGAGSSGSSTNPEITPPATITKTPSTPTEYSPDGSLTEYGKSIREKANAPTVGKTGTERAQGVLDASDLMNDPQYRALAEAQNLITQGQTGAQFAGVGGINTLGNKLGGNYANLFAPQSTSNLAGERGLLNPLLSTAQAGNAAEAQRLLSAAGLKTQGASTVLGAGAPSGNIIQVDPFTGKAINPEGLTELAKQAGTLSGIQSGAGSLAQEYQTGQATLRAADNIQNQIVSTLQANPTLNVTPISAITNLNELLSGQTSVPGQQLLAQQIKAYIDTLGIDPATAVNIAQQSQGTLAQLLDSLRTTAQSRIEAKNISGTTPTGGSTGGGFAEAW